VRRQFFSPIPFRLTTSESDRALASKETIRALRSRLDELAAALPLMDPEMLLSARAKNLRSKNDRRPKVRAAPVERTSRLRVNARAPVAAFVLDRRPEEPTVFFSIEGNDCDAEIELPARYTAFVQALIARKEFTAEEALGWGGEDNVLNWEDVQAALEALLEGGLVELLDRD
jgi:hypothetical protein